MESAEAGAVAARQAGEKLSRSVLVI